MLKQFSAEKKTKVQLKSLPVMAVFGSKRV